MFKIEYTNSYTFTCIRWFRYRIHSYSITIFKHVGNRKSLYMSHLEANDFYVFFYVFLTL